jgi:hypothetical protein
MRMGEFKVVDKTGTWLVSKASFTMTQPGGHRFEPGVPTKIDIDGWIKGQIEAKVLAECDDPFPPPVTTKPSGGPGDKK